MPGLTLYLNACVDEAETQSGRILSVSAFQQTTETRLRLSAPLFVDASGDGTLGALAGADFVVGRESRDTYGERHAPLVADHCTMGSSLMFQARDVGRPVPFFRPPWANQYTEHDLRHREHADVISGYWWIELGGGRYETIADAEILRDELLKAVYGMWDHIKNGGDHGAENMDLEWVGILPGKRESRRFLGDYVLTEQDCQEGRIFEDAVAYGGWPMDVHTVEGFLNDADEPTVYLHLPQVYTIPYRCLYSRNISNLFLCGRIISASHMAFASARVMATCAVGGQAVGTAAAMARAGGAGAPPAGRPHAGAAPNPAQGRLLHPRREERGPPGPGPHGQGQRQLQLTGLRAGKAAFRRVQARGAGEQLLGGAPGAKPLAPPTAGRAQDGGGAAPEL